MNSSVNRSKIRVIQEIKDPYGYVGPNGFSDFGNDSYSATNYDYNNDDFGSGSSNQTSERDNYD